MPINKQEVLEYLNAAGESPFEKWLTGLKDIKGRAFIRKKINQLRLGYLLDIQSLGSGLFEVRIFFGPGYRIYFGERNKNTVVLLWGGNKGSQKRDIKKANQYWKIYKEEKNEK